MMTDFDLGHCTQLRGTGVQDYFILLLFPIFVANTIWILRQPTFYGKRFFLTANAALIAWLFAVVMELFSIAPGCKIMWSMLAFPGIGLLPVSWFLFVYRYTNGESGKVLPWQWALIIAIPTLATLAALTSPWHGFFYTSETMPSSDAIGAPIIYDYGPLFYTNAALLYGFLIGSFIMLGIGVASTIGISRLLYVLLFFMTALPSAANVGYIAFGFNIAGFDPTPFLFSFVLLAYAALISLSSFFQISAIAKDMIFDSLPTAVVVVSIDGRIMASNKLAQFLLPPIARAAPVVWDVPVLADLMTLAVSGEKLVTPPEVRINDEVFEVGLTPINDDRRASNRPVIGFALVFFQVTQRKQLQLSLAEALDESDAKISEILSDNQRIADEVRTDPLTGLLNRRSLNDDFEAMTASGTTAVFAVMVDIDFFKVINDRLGHAKGDEVLIAVATCLQRAFRSTDRVFRMGGEEFLVLLTEIDLQSLYRRISKLRNDMDVAGKLLLPNNLRLQFSAGVATWPIDSTNLPDLLDSADRRLYTAKQSGRNRTTGPRAETK